MSGCHQQPECIASLMLIQLEDLFIGFWAGFTHRAVDRNLLWPANVTEA